MLLCLMEGLITTQKQIQWDKESVDTTYNDTTVSNNAATRYLALYSRLQQIISVHLTEKVLLNLQLMFPMVILEFLISVMVDIYSKLVT